MRLLRLVTAGAIALALSACVAPLVVAPIPSPQLLQASPTPTSAVSPSTGGFSGALRRALPSVVGIYAPPARSAGPLVEDAAELAADASGTNIGAGFFIDADGRLVTAAHVVADARQILVKLSDQRVMVATLIGVDRDIDIALLQIDAAAVPQPIMGRSAASRPGDWVLAVGEPYGLHRSAVAGIVAGRARHFAEDREGLFIQSDLALNPGNSGGPLINVEGEIIGMNLRTVVSPFSVAGVSLSIPIEVVLQIADELRGAWRGAPQRPRLGASFEDVAPQVAIEVGRAYASGALLTRVGVGSAAERIGLRVGDIIVGMNGHAVGDGAELARRLLGWRQVEGSRWVLWRDRRYLQLVGR